METKTLTTKYCFYQRTAGRKRLPGGVALLQSDTVAYGFTQHREAVFDRMFALSCCDQHAPVTGPRLLLPWSLRFLAVRAELMGRMTGGLTGGLFLPPSGTATGLAL
ncbi:hypothetical protein E6O75_ATG03739 [Venturia nashicola]|uniref:Uncharacterized protein n=1 Tax=Venturia nashicola TaxID=86259 RepID=A0A4Z1PJS8_9PEZI|nr:hypothetical protein E6O75_ATG03739 [Venturia nashicola]